MHRERKSYCCTYYLARCIKFTTYGSKYFFIESLYASGHKFIRKFVIIEKYEFLGTMIYDY